MNFNELLAPEMTVRSIVVERKDEVFAKGIAQAEDGLCCVFSTGGGQLWLVAAKDRAADLDALIDDLEMEFNLDNHQSAREVPSCASTTNVDR